MTAVVVDSSVAVKWFVPEALSDVAARLLDDAFELHAPDLLITEFANVLWKKVRRREIQRVEAREILAALRQVPITIVSSADLVEAALEIAAVHDRTVYDALYVALAVRMDCVLITADDRLVREFVAGPLGPHLRALSSLT